MQTVPVPEFGEPITLVLDITVDGAIKEVRLLRLTRPAAPSDHRHSRLVCQEISRWDISPARSFAGTLEDVSAGIARLLAADVSLQLRVPFPDG